MLKFSAQFEKVVSSILIVLAMIFIVYQVIQLIWNTVDSFSRRFREVGLTYSPEYAKTIAVLFFNVLLMMEIMETIKVFSQSHIVKAQIILIVCLIAVSRKILALGEETSDPKAELALAGLIISLAAGYYLVSRIAGAKSSEKEIHAENQT
jgi:uncharacterized membrane protein (DUF373 family)